MADILASIEHLSVVKALKTSFFAYPVVNALHILAIGALLTSVLLMDLRLVGAFGSVPKAPLIGLLRRVAITAFVGALVTGLLLFSVRAREYAVMPVFLVKMTLVLLAGVNFLGFHFVFGGDKGADGPAATGPAIVSMVLWTAVLFCGRFIGFL